MFAYFSYDDGSNGTVFRDTGHLCRVLTGLWWIPRTKVGDARFDVFFDLRLY